MKSRCFFSGTVALWCLLAVLSCGKAKPDPVQRVKAGHLAEAPKITLEELAARYQFADPVSIKWDAIADQNKNEYVRLTMAFEDYKVIAASVEASIGSVPGMEYGMLWMTLDEFYGELLFNADEPDITGAALLDVKLAHFPLDDPFEGETFFTLQGGSLAIDFLTGDTPDAAQEIHSARLTLRFESPNGTGGTLDYSLSTLIPRKVISRMLLENIDLMAAASDE
jgi:hypothetical protein